MMKPSTRAGRFRTGFVAGLAAGAVATFVMLLLNYAVGGISLPQVFGDDLTALMPPQMFEYLHRTIGGDAKHYLFYGIVVGQCLVFGVSAGLYSMFVSVRIKRRPRLYRARGFFLGLILWVLTGILLLPLAGAGFFGILLSIGILNTAISLAIVGLVFGLLYSTIENWLIERRTQTRQQGKSLETAVRRRTLLRRGAILVGIGVVGIVAWEFIANGFGTTSATMTRLLQQYKSKIVPPPAPNYGDIQPVQFLSPEITPNDQYYVVSKNLFSDPTVDGKSWQLSVSGQVEHPFTLNYDQLLAMPMQKQYESMMCISNEVGGQYMSNALWEGVPLVDLLNRAGIKSGATKVVLHAADDYSDSIHLTKAVEPTTLIAVKMNNVTLPQGHGYPARLLVPGIYGMKHVKWITGIEVVNTDFQGYWQQRGWSDAAPIRLTSRIDTPLTGSSVSAKSTTYIAGVAFSGNKGISEVDVSLDNGQSWQRATLKQPLSNLSWVLWELTWNPGPGSYTILVRAIDLEGNVQDPSQQPPLPNGSSGYHSIDISVA